MTDFEELSRQFQSPVAVVNEAVVVDTEPPVIEVIQVEPARLLVGPECPGSPNMVEVTYNLFDEGGIFDTAAEWEVGEQRGTAPVEKIDDETFVAFVGPVDTTGTLIIFVEAKDNAQNFTRSEQINVEVVKCIG
jgi:hypothetical protein